MQCGTGVSMQEKTAVHVSRLGGGRVMCRGREAEVMAGQWLLAESAEHMQLCDKCVLQQLLLLLLRLAVCLAVLPTFFTTTGVWLPSSSVSVALYTLPKPPEPNSLPSFRSSCACGGGGGEQHVRLLQTQQKRRMGLARTVCAGAGCHSRASCTDSLPACGCVCPVPAPTLAMGRDRLRCKGADR